MKIALDFSTKFNRSITAQCVTKTIAKKAEILRTIQAMVQTNNLNLRNRDSHICSQTYPLGLMKPEINEEIRTNIEVAPKDDGIEGAAVEIEGVKDGDREDLIGGAVGGVEVPDDINVDVEKVDGGAVGGLEVPVVEDVKGGAKESISNVLEEGEIGRSVGSEREGGEDVYGMGGFEEFGSRGAEGGVSGADVGGGAECVVEPVHHIPRWKLYEILAHAEGECIVSVV